MRFLVLNRNSVTILLAIMLILTFIQISFAKDSKTAIDWYQWRGPNRDGISDEKGWSTTWTQGMPKQLWKTNVGMGFSAVSINKNRVYTMGNIDNTDYIYCLDANSGSEIWNHKYHCINEDKDFGGPSSTPTVDGNNVYTLSREGDFFCLNAETGNTIWYSNVQKDFGAKPPTWKFTSSPLILDNIAIVDVGITLALNKSTGELIWKTEDYGGGYSSPYAFSFKGSKLLAVYNGFGLVILDSKSGKEISKQKFGPDNFVNVSTPIVSDGKVFVSSGYGVGCMLADVSGAIAWQNKDMKNHFNSCVLWKGYLYGFDESDLKCMDFQTGDAKWTQKGLGKSSLMIADSKLVIMTENGNLVIADAVPENFKELARAKILDGLCWTVPVLFNGRIYCRNHDGILVCLDVKGK